MGQHLDEYAYPYGQNSDQNDKIVSRSQLNTK